MLADGSGGSSIRCGDSQSTNASPSSEHSKVASTSLALNVNVAVVASVVGRARSGWSCRAGRRPSTVQRRRLVDVAERVPRGDLERVRAVDQAVVGRRRGARRGLRGRRASRRRSTPAWSDENVNVAVGWSRSSRAACRRCRLGRSDDRPAVLGRRRSRRCRAMSVARTRNTCSPGRGRSTASATRTPRTARRRASTRTGRPASAAKMKVAMRSPVSAGGPFRIVVSGGVVSMLALDRPRVALRC